MDRLRGLLILFGEFMCSISQYYDNEAIRVLMFLAVVLVTNQFKSMKYNITRESMTKVSMSEFYLGGYKFGGSSSK